MDKPLIVPRIVFIGMLVMVFGAVLAAWAYYYETQVLANGGDLPLFSLFADAFKVGLGAFIGVLSQWASRVFGESGAGQAAAGPAPASAEPEAGLVASQDGAPAPKETRQPGDRPGDIHE